MAFIEAKCPACGGAIQLDDKRESGYCLYCGTRVLLAEAIPRRVKIEGFQTLDDKLENAETYLRFGENSKAYRLLMQLTDEYTSDYRAWWLLAKLMRCSAYSPNSANPDFGLVDALSPSREFQYAVELANEDAKKILFAAQDRYLEEIHENWQNSLRKIDRTVRGDYSFINHSHMENCGFEVVHGELYYWEDRAHNPPDLVFEKVNWNTLRIRFIHNGKVAVGDKFFVMSGTAPEEYVRFRRAYDELKQSKRNSALGLVIGLASLVVFILFLLLRKG